MKPTCLENLTVSIVSHGHGSMVERLLSDLNGQVAEGCMNVILTQNIPEPAVTLEDYPNLRIHVLNNPEPLGFGENHNAAFQYCKTKWFAVLNPDLRVPSAPFTSLLSLAEDSGPVGLVAPTVLNSTGSKEDAVRTNLTPMSLMLRRISGRQTTPVDTSNGGHTSFFWVAGMFMLFRSEAYRAVNGFDERFFLYCEDYDICARLRLAGYPIKVDPTSYVVHDAQRDSHRSFKHLRMHLMSLFRVWVSSTFWRITIGRYPAFPATK